MKSDKCNCPYFRVMLFVVSAIIALGIWYFKEGKHSFLFLTERDDIFSFLGTVFLIAILPFAIFYIATENEKHRQSARKLSVLGFLPAIAFLLFILFSSSHD